jgi:hypothetical protein
VGLRLAWALALAAGMSATSAGREPPGDGERSLAELGFSASDIAAARTGSIVARLLPQGDDSAAFVVGVARIAAPEETLVKGIRTIEAFRKGGRVLQSGRFSNPPGIEDLQPLVFGSQDLEDLRRCRIGDCDVRVDAETMRLASGIDWAASDARAKASRTLKRALLGLTKDYLERGPAGMWVYHESKTPDDSAAEFAKLLESSARLVAENPEFYRYLLAFPATAPPSVESFVYWSKESLRRPVVSIVQLFLQRVPGKGGARYFIALKHIYDSHYFRAYAEFLILIPCPGKGTGFYLVRSVRARIDPPHSLRGILLGKIKREMRSALKEDLERTRRRLEVATETDRPAKITPAQ